MDCEGNSLRTPPPTLFNPLKDQLPAAERWKECLQGLAFRDPSKFIAGGLHDHLDQWDSLVDIVNNEQSVEFRKCLRDKVDIFDYFKPFKGNFFGLHLDSDIPPKCILPNYASCEQYGPIIAEQLHERIKNGSMELVGKIGEVDPPHLVMPLVVVSQRDKIRLCHDERLLNLFMVHKPFMLEGLAQIPAMLCQGDKIASSDEKSAYDGVLISPRSRTFFGLQFGGWYLQYRTLPFGWSISLYIYQSIGMQLTSYLRSLGIKTIQYLDDRFLGPYLSQSDVTEHATGLSIFMNAAILSNLGYTIAMEKSIWLPSNCIRYLGLLVDATVRCFRIPADKKEAFKTLRDSILSQKSVNILTLQKFMGKCMSLSLCVPAAKLYIRVMASAIGKAEKSSQSIPIRGDLKDEIKE